MVTRAEVIQRAQTLWKPGTVPYSQNTIHPGTGYRQDCSGFASMCWAIPLNVKNSWGGLNTVTLVTDGWIKEIAPAELMPGDAVGICGPGSAGDAGHIVIFDRWLNDDPNNDDYWLYEQAGGRSGPVRRVLTYPYGGPWGQWKAYRLKGISDGAPPTPTPGGAVKTGYEPLGYPSKMLLGDQERGTALQQADLWGNEMLGGSPYDGAKSFRSQQLQRIEDAVMRSSVIELRAEDIQAIAALITDQVAEAVAEKIAQRMQQ